MRQEMRFRMPPWLVWLCVAVLAGIFLYEGIDKLVGHQARFFASVGYPAWSSIPIGAGEVVVGLGVLRPRARPLSCVGIEAIMAAALATLVWNGRWDLLPLTIVASGTAAALLWHDIGRRARGGPVFLLARFSAEPPAP